MISETINITSALLWADSLSDNELFAFIERLTLIADQRRIVISKAHKQKLSHANKVKFCCPRCGEEAVKNGKKKDGTQLYRCRNPECLHQFVSTSGTSFSSSKLTDTKIKQIVTLVLLGCPAWVIAWIAETAVKTVAFWRDRCLDAAKEWADEAVLSDHAWFDEMEFSPNRADEGANGNGWVKNKTTGRYRKEIQVVIAFDEHGEGFAKVLSKKGHTSFREIKEAMGGRVREKTILTHDAAASHNCLFTDSALGLVNDAVKANPRDQNYDRKMGPLNNLCSYLRFEHMKHKGIKTEKLEHYLDLFIYRYFHVRNGSLEKTVEELFNRVSGTKKSHKYRETFSKTAKW